MCRQHKLAAALACAPHSAGGQKARLALARAAYSRADIQVCAAQPAPPPPHTHIHSHVHCQRVFAAGRHALSNP